MRLTGIADPVELLILGHPRTKKNSMVITGTRAFPSGAWRKWVKEGVLWWLTNDRKMPWPALQRLTDQHWNCRAIFYRTKDLGDLDNYQVGLADFLAARNVLLNDRIIRGWDGSRLRIDRGHPRVEVLLTPLAE